MRQVQALGVAVAALAACCGQAIAQGTYTDVIVGDLMDVSNYTTGAPINGKRAYAVGTTSCNLGTRPLTWIDEGTSVLYPVISQNMYRVNNGRIIQLGQAWLKHGFCALNGTVCSTCPDVPGGHTCDHLDPGCSDPYTSGLNGSQGGLGPKSEVNPSTGAFPANAAVGTSTGDATLRGRLIVNDSDLVTAGDTANALFFVSSIYIHPEDPTFNTDNNNSSYRRVSVNQTNKAITLQNTTQRQLPPIFAWRDYGGGLNGNNPVSDPTVVLNPIDVPNDGRFWVGSKVINLGGGQYRFEYAVMNLNSNRGADGFSIPLPPGAVVTNVGFHDVDYHSGEIQDGTDWTSTVSSDSVTWNYPNNQVQDNRENVLRWDTMYNFWFECNLGGAGGVATLDLFGAAAPANSTAVAYVPSANGSEPFNNACATPFPMGSGGISVDTTGATTDGPTECIENGQAGIINDVWYTYTTTCAGAYTLSICDANFDTKIAVYSACPTGPGTSVACSDDYEGCGSNNSGSRVDWNATGATTYFVRVGSRQGAAVTSGVGQLNVVAPNCNGIPNDNCSNPTFLADGVEATGTTVGAAATPTMLTGCTTGGNAAPDVFFAYRPQVSGFVRFDTCPTTFDTILAAYSDCTSAPIGCNDDRSPLTAPLCSANASSSSLRVNLTAGNTYILRLTGWGSSQGAYTVKAIGGGGVLPPSNDTCSNRQSVGQGTVNFSNVGAGTETANSPTFGQIFNDLWFTRTFTQAGTLTVSTCDAPTFDTKLAVYESNNCSGLEAKLRGWSDNAACNPNAASVTIPVNPGAYAIRVGAVGAGGFGSGTLNVTFTAGPVCDGIDFNNDTSLFDPQDIDAFLSVYSEGPCVPANATCNDIDFNNDGSVFDPCDIDSFLLQFSEGPCTNCGQ
ncbi:MAG: hypothetical protein U0640_00160 [Phycisphaerales bacterium]